jgi:hypothetical protein
VTLPVVWIPEANKDLLEARVWYSNIRPELGERFALAVEATVEALTEHPVAIPSRLPEHEPCGSAPLPVRPILRGAGTSDCGNRLLPQAQPNALASTLATPKRNSPRFQEPKA